jgi:hypothetical protein
MITKMYKSVTINVAAIGIAMLTVLTQSPEDTKVLMQYLFNLDDTLVDVFYKGITMLTSLLTFTGVTYGRLRKAKPLEER